MINALCIQGFQSHKDTLLHFHPGVNIIVGASDSGKTSILRALRWLIWNRPGGEDFRSDWGGETSVEIIVGNNSIIRSKDKENLYEIGAVDSQDYKQLKAFGTKVPEEIQKILNIDDTNLQKQFDSPFLISSTPGEVAGYFNQVAHLEKIDSSVLYVNGRIHSLTAKHKADKEALKEYREELKQYDYLDRFEIDLEELEHQQSSLINKIASRKRLGEHLDLMTTNNQMIEKQEQITVLKEPVNAILKLYEEREEMWDDLNDFQETSVEIRKIDIDIEYLKIQINTLPQVESLLKLYAEQTKLQSNFQKFRLAIRELNNTSKQQHEYKVLIEEKKALFQKHMPIICPLCNTNLKGKSHTYDKNK